MIELPETEAQTAEPDKEARRASWAPENGGDGIKLSDSLEPPSKRPSRPNSVVVAPTMHTPASISATTGAIADSDSRKLTESAFM